MKHGNGGVTHSEQPQQHDADEDCEENPCSPHIGIETIIKANDSDRREDHGLQKRLSDQLVVTSLMFHTVEYSYKAMSYPSLRVVVVK